MCRRVGQQGSRPLNAGPSRPLPRWSDTVLLNKLSEGLPGLVTHGREVTEAYGVEVQAQEFLHRPHSLLRTLGDACGRRTEPAGELVLKRVSNDDGPFARQVEGNAAFGVSGR